MVLPLKSLLLDCRVKTWLSLSGYYKSGGYGGGGCLSCGWVDGGTHHSRISPTWLN